MPTATALELRDLRPDDWAEVAAIYRDGLRNGLATFETEVPSWADWQASHPAGLRVLAELYDETIGWAALSPVSARRCYRGVMENSVYVGREHRGKGVGRALLEELVRRAEAAGVWTIQTSVFPENEASVALHLACGFRIVGTRERIAKRDGLWRDTLLLERRSEVIR